MKKTSAQKVPQRMPTPEAAPPVPTPKPSARARFAELLAKKHEGQPTVGPAANRSAAANEAMAAFFVAVAQVKTPTDLAADLSAALSGETNSPRKLNAKALGLRGVQLADLFHGYAGLAFIPQNQSAFEADRMIAGWQALLELKPKNAMECMLGVQILRTHAAAMDALDHASNSTDREASEIWANRAMRFMRLSAQQCECLARLQGTISQQRIIVERVSVAEGGRAVIAAVTGGAGGQGSAEDDCRVVVGDVNPRGWK